MSGGYGFSYAATDPMNNNANDNYNQGGGGGPGNPSPGGSTPGGGGRGGNARKGYDEQTLIPCTINMLNKASTHNTPGGSADGFILPDKRVIYTVKVVGAVRSVNEQSTNVLYEVEDGTGLIDVKQWLDDSECTGLTEMRVECKDNVYVRVIGQLKEYDGKKMLVAYSIRKVSTGNEITHHFLETIYSSNRALSPQRPMGGVGMGVKNEFGQPAPGGAPPPTVGAPLGMNGGQNGNGNFNGEGNNPCNDAVLEYFKANSQSETGAGVDGMIHELQAATRYNEMELRKSVEHLSTEGFIYSTIDENYYKFAA